MIIGNINIQSTNWTWPNFRLQEFECHCSSNGGGRLPGCQEVIVDSDLLDVLEKIRAMLGGRAMVITSGYRCPTHNEYVGGVPSSQHCLGKAVHIVVAGVPPALVATAAENVVGPLGGVGRYNGFTHVDVRGAMARWMG